MPRKPTKPSPKPKGKPVYLRKKTISRRENEIFLKLLVAERLGAGVSQRQLAKRLSVYQPYVARFEKGERRLDLIEFFDIAKAVGFDPQIFIGKLLRAIGDGKK